MSITLRAIQKSLGVEVCEETLAGYLVILEGGYTFRYGNHRGLDVGEFTDFEQFLNANVMPGFRPMHPITDHGMITAADLKGGV